MPTIAVIRIQGNLLQDAVESARIKLDEGESQVVMDFSLVRRLDSRLLASISDLAVIAKAKDNSIILHAVNVEVYKALKLARLTSPFSFSD